MNNKIFGGITICTIGTTILSYLYQKKKIVDLEDKLNKQQELNKSLMDANVELKQNNENNEQILVSPLREQIFVSPSRIILNSIDGSYRVFNTDCDTGFVLLGGSNPEENDYCIMAQNVPKLYTMLLSSIKNQLKSHYVYQINKNIFDRIMDDIVITISFSFVDEFKNDAIITDVNAVIPFEIFSENEILKMNTKTQVFSVKGGELNIDNIICYFGSNNNIDANKINKNDTKSSNIQKSETKKEEKEMVNYDTSLSEENIEFIVDSVGFNREALNAFINRLKILLIINPKAGNEFNSIFNTIIIQIHNLIEINELTDENKLTIINTIKTMNSNIKKTYGPDIKKYTQSSGK